MGFKKDTQTSLENVAKDIGYLLTRDTETNQRIDLWARKFQTLSRDFYLLQEELATNGVVRDLRKLEKSHAELVRHTSVLITDHDEQLQSLKVNGVATAINRLQREVLTDKQEEQSNGLTRAFLAAAGAQPELEPTLKGKVDAIIAHLGLDIHVQPEEVTKAKVVAKKVAAPKKKGRR